MGLTGVFLLTSPETAPSCTMLVFRSSRSSCPRAGVYPGFCEDGNPARTTCGPGPSKKRLEIGTSFSVISSNLGLHARRVHCPANFAHCFDESDEHRAAHDRVA